MRVLLITTTRERGGAEKQVCRLRQVLEGAGVESEWTGLFSPEAQRSRVSSAGRAAITTLALGIRRSSHVVTFNFHPNALGPLVSFPYSPRLITSIRTEALRQGGRAKLLWPAMRRSNAVVFNARAVRAAFVADGLVDPSQAVVIPNFVRPMPSVQRPYAQDGPFRFLAVGRLHPAKAFDVLLHAMRHAQATSSRQLSLDIIGEGAEAPDLRAMAHRVGLDNQVRFLGWRADPWKDVEQYDAFVHSARWEGQPNALLEAMSAGLPVIATLVGGVSDLKLDARGCGLAVAAEDPEGLGTAMGTLAETGHSDLAAMGRAGRRYVEQEHSTDRILEQWLRVMRLT